MLSTDATVKTQTAKNDEDLDIGVADEAVAEEKRAAHKSARV